MSRRTWVTSPASSEAAAVAAGEWFFFMGMLSMGLVQGNHLQLALAVVALSWGVPLAERLACAVLVDLDAVRIQQVAAGAGPGQEADLAQLGVGRIVEAEERDVHRIANQVAAKVAECH